LRAVGMRQHHRRWQQRSNHALAAPAALHYQEPLQSLVARQATCTITQPITNRHSYTNIYIQVIHSRIGSKTLFVPRCSQTEQLLLHRSTPLVLLLLLLHFNHGHALRHCR
jgi:hypothetical protein